MEAKRVPARATYDDLLAVPDSMVAEIVDGRLYASPRPSSLHASASMALGQELGPPFRSGRGGPGGWILLFEPELHLGEHVLVPDLAGWRRSRMPELPDAAYLTLAPDWVCEVLSPRTVSLDRVRKLAAYGGTGVGHAWLVDPQARTLEVLRRDGALWTLAGSWEGDTRVRAEPFEALELDLALLWAR
jgi:Uma2 family endonuclease